MYLKNTNYYTSKVDEYDEILNKVEERLKELTKLYEYEKKIEDSILKAEQKLQPKLKDLKGKKTIK